MDRLLRINTCPPRRILCHAGNMTTGTDVATSSRDCYLQPGMGMVNGVAAPCQAGAYNGGFNTRACTRCPGGLTTPGKGASTSLQCVAPAGAANLVWRCGRVVCTAAG